MSKGKSFKRINLAAYMPSSLGIDPNILLALVALMITVLGIVAAFFYWKGRLDEWKGGIDTWKSDVTSLLERFRDDIGTLTLDIRTIKNDIGALRADVAMVKTSLEKEASGDSMIRRRSPLIASEEAKRILRDMSIISQVSPSILLIKNKVEERSRSSVYSDTDDPEEKFIEIAPGVIHELIEKGVINGEKIDLAMKKLGEVYSPTIATYYGVLLLIASYVLEELEKKNLIASFSLIYKQIDMISTLDLKKLLAMFDQNTEKAIDNLKRTIKTLSEIGDKEELIRTKNKLAMLHIHIGQIEKAEKELKEAIELNPSFAEAYVNRGNAYASLKQFEKAIVDFDKAIELNPFLALAYKNRGNAYSRLGETEKAIRDHNRALEFETKISY